MAVDRAADAHEHFVEGLALARQASDSCWSRSTPLVGRTLFATGTSSNRPKTHYLEALRAYRGVARGRTGRALANLARNAIALRAEAKAIQYLREAVAIRGCGTTLLTGQPILTCCAGLAALRGEWAAGAAVGAVPPGVSEQHGLFDLCRRAVSRLEHVPGAQAVGTDPAGAAFATGRALSTETALREAEAWLDALPSDEPPP
ncbi:MAG: hypothetical protein IPI40_07370 [Betaproteobacteria bacterium]|nr:hypothetical protein [Betaproteobacteria bacterium]